MRLSSLGVAVALLLAGSLSATAEPRPPDRKAIRALVEREARALGFPPALALAVAHAESNFDPRAESRKGARGVMQIMPATARDEYAIEAGHLWDPRINIRLGIHFLKRLVASYGGRIDRALAHYNGGTAAASVPLFRAYPETRDYVRRVQRLEERYRLGGGGFEPWMPRTREPRFSAPASARN